MTLSDQVGDVRARTQNPATRPVRRASSANTPGRPSLRVVDGRTQNPQPPTPALNDHAASTHVEGARESLTGHLIGSTHPPTALDAAGNLWLDSDQVRHGLAGQLAAATAGLAQTIGLATCWAVAHVFFSTRTRAAIFALLLLASLSTCAITSHN